MGTTTKEIGSSSFNDMISSVDRRSEYVENRAGANVRLNNFLTPYTLDDKSSILNAPCGYSNGVYASLRPSDVSGPELVVNGDLETSGSITTTSYSLGYVIGNSNDLGVSIINNALVLDRPSGTNTDYARVYLTNGTNTSFLPTSLNGKKIKLQFEIKSKSGQIDVRYFNNGYVNVGDLDVGIHTFDLVVEINSSIFVLKNDGLNSSMTIDNISIKEDTSADLDFVRGTAATRVTKYGLVKDVQILSDNLVQNGNFEEIGPELISNGDFSQQGSELVTGNNSNFDSSTGDWQQFRGVMSWDSSIQAGKWTDNGNTGSPKGFTMSGGVIPTSSGKIYRVKFIAKTDSSSSFDFDWIGESSTFNTISNPNLTSDFQDYEFTFTASGNNQRLYIALNNSTIGNGESYWIDNVSIFEVGQDWTLSAGWSIADGKAIGSAAGTYDNLEQRGLGLLNKSLKLTFDIVDYTSGTFRLIPSDRADGLDERYSGNGSYTVYYKSLDNDLVFQQQDFVGGVTNISVKEVGQNWSISSNVTVYDGKANFNIVNGDFASADQSLALVSGKSYKLTMSVTGASGSSGKSVRIQDSIAVAQLGTSSAYVVTLDETTQEVEAYWVADNNSDAIRIARNSGGDYAFSIDNVSVIEITNDTNLPRIDYTNGTGALLLEPQSTNLIRYSEDFTNAAWTGFNYTITPNYAVSPDGSNNASRYVGSTNNQDFYIAVTVTSDYTYSFYVKAINAPFIRLRTTNGSCWFDMGNKTVGTNTFTGDANIQNVGNDWYRISVTTSHTQNSINAYIHAHATDNTTNELDGCEFLLWGAQLEQLPYPTSYIPTNGSTVTRNKDQAYRSGISNLINSNEGVLYAEFSGLGDTSVSRIMSISDGTIDNRVAIQYTNANDLFLQVRAGGTSVASKSYTLSDITDNIKTAVKYKENDFSFWVNGVEIHTDTLGAVPTGLNRLGFDNSADGVVPFHGRVRSVAVFNEALTDEELAKITSTTQQEVFYEMRDKMQQINADYYEFGDYTTRLKKLF